MNDKARIWIKFDRDNTDTWPKENQQVYWVAEKTKIGTYAEFRITRRKTLIKRTPRVLPYFVGGYARWEDTGYWRPIQPTDSPSTEHYNIG